MSGSAARSLQSRLGKKEVTIVHDFMDGNLLQRSSTVAVVSSGTLQVLRSIIIFSFSRRHSSTKSSSLGIPENPAPSGCLTDRSSFLRLEKGRLVMFPVAWVTLSTVSSWKTTAVLSEVKLTSNSTTRAPFLAARRRASKLFSGASRPAARCATSQSEHRY